VEGRRGHILIKNYLVKVQPEMLCFARNSSFRFNSSEVKLALVIAALQGDDLIL
jgi:hypothetical protein